ncbi:glycosyltransferase family 2 protein [Butyrivibrio sp. FC2001]|uniref:glycosyltransferase family 2 protein n=1 Tax=Butyrivibrio sp. FC2001 TaxID=1280671 RepID=UPI0004057651|nr:glycosyltransferase family 2 protein [Butyrivibrio sp. FC2001]
MKLVSVVVPAYNCILSIDRCINSLLAQTYENIEIIIVDDESTDGTCDKCLAFAKDNSRIKFHSVKHCGVSQVRNEGLTYASGDYIMFADADDYVKDSFVAKMVAAIEADPDCDMAICSYNRVVYGGLYPIRSLTDAGIITKEEYLINTLKDPGHHYFGVLWNKIFKRNIICEMELSFKKDITLGEDFVFSLNYLERTGKINIIDDRLYFYCYQKNDTLSRIIHKSLQDCECEMDNRDKIFENYIEAMEKAGLYDRMKKRIYHYWVVFLVRQRYSLRTEYKWDREDKRLWKKEIHQNSNIKSALCIYSRKEVQMEYVAFAGVQTAKNVMKKVIKKVRA